eukprot:2754322-Alexandrium_andersonii.AAC.1
MQQQAPGSRAPTVVLRRRRGRAQTCPGAVSPDTSARPPGQEAASRATGGHAGAVGRLVPSAAR